MIIYIYKITNKINGKSYIGQTMDVERRWKEHCSKSSKCHKLSKAIKKYGPAAFEMEVLMYTSNHFANMWETTLIKHFNSVTNGYNICYESSTRRGVGHTIEAREKMSKSRKGKVGTFKGKHHSDETKAKLSAAKRGKKVTCRTLVDRSGENNPNAKLTNQQRIEIYQLHVNDKLSYSTLAKMFNVTKSAIQHIIRTHDNLHLQNNEQHK